MATSFVSGDNLNTGDGRQQGTSALNSTQGHLFPAGSPTNVLSSPWPALGVVTAVGQGATTDLASLLAGTLEEAVLRFSKPGSPQLQTPLHELIQGGLTTWDNTAAVLRTLSLNPEADATDEGSWTILGLSAMHGPAPSIADVHARLKLGRDIAQICEQPEWSQADALLAQAFCEKLEKAARLCLAKLPEVLRHRKLLKTSSSVPRWWEPDPDFTVFLAEEARKDNGATVVALHLSNLHGLDLTPLSPIVKNPTECRQIYQSLYGSPAEINQCIINFQGANVILWAPDNGRALGQVLGAIDKIAKEGSVSFNLHFLVPFVPMPGCPNADMIGELWSHQMLASRYSHMRKSVTYYLQPMRCAFSGQSAPLHHLKNLALITMSSTGTPQAPTIKDFKREIVQHKIGRAIRVDVPEEQHRGIYLFLKNLQIMHCLGWEVGQKSPGATPSAKRVLLIGYFDEAKVSSLDLVGIARSLRDMPELGFAFVGPESMFANPHALIMDLADIAVLHDAKDMLRDIVLVPPSRALVDTQHTSNEWEHVLTHQYQQDPKSAIKCIRYRLGIFQGKTFAKAGALAKYAYNERARQRLTRVPGEIRDREMLMTSLQISGLPQTQRSQIVQKIINKVQELGIPLNHQTGDMLKPGEWSIGGDSREGGEINLLLR